MTTEHPRARKQAKHSWLPSQVRQEKMLVALLQSIASLPSLSMTTRSEAEFTPTGLLTGSPLSSGTEGVGRRSRDGKEAGL